MKNKTKIKVECTECGCEDYLSLVEILDPVSQSYRLAYHCGGCDTETYVSDAVPYDPLNDELPE